MVIQRRLGPLLPLRALLRQCVTQPDPGAQVARRGDRSPDRGYYLATKERIGTGRASLAVARKLLKRSYHTLRELGEEALAPA